MKMPEFRFSVLDVNSFMKLYEHLSLTFSDIVKNLLIEIDPDLWKYIDMLSIGDMNFCHR